MAKRFTRRMFLQLMGLITVEGALTSCGHPEKTLTIALPTPTEAAPKEYPKPQSAVDIYVDGKINTIYAPARSAWTVDGERERERMKAKLRWFIGKLIDDPRENGILNAILEKDVDLQVQLFERLDITDYMRVISARYSPDGFIFATDSPAVSRTIPPMSIGAVNVGYGDFDPNWIVPNTSSPDEDFRKISAVIVEHTRRVFENHDNGSPYPLHCYVVPPKFRDQFSQIISNDEGLFLLDKAAHQIMNEHPGDFPDDHINPDYFETAYWPFANTADVLSGEAFSEEDLALTNLREAFRFPPFAELRIRGFAVLPDANLEKFDRFNELYAQSIGLLVSFANRNKGNILNPSIYRDQTPMAPYQIDLNQMFVIRPHAVVVVPSNFFGIPG